VGHRRPPNRHRKPQTRLRVLAARFARALLRLSTLLAKRAQGRPGADLAPAVCCANKAQRRPHSSIQVVPITRPSLRDGRTAYAVLSREPNFPSGLPRPANWRCRPPGWARAHLRDSLTVATTARTTRFCRTRSAPLVRTKPRAHRDYPPCPRLSRTTLPRPPQPGSQT